MVAYLYSCFESLLIIYPLRYLANYMLNFVFPTPVVPIMKILSIFNLCVKIIIYCIKKVLIKIVVISKRANSLTNLNHHEQNNPIKMGKKSNIIAIQ